jgi:RNAse (barnase) inhibitor barstar
MSKKEYILDGHKFSTLEEFAEHFSDVVLKDHKWKGHLDAFNDILRGGFGTPEDGFILRWKNSQTSRERLGYPETVRQLERRLIRCHSTAKEKVREELKQAQNQVGPTVFDWLVEIIHNHCEGGDEDDGLELILE